MTSGYAVATLVVFIVSIFFVIRPYTIPIPHLKFKIPINLTTAPILAIALLWAAQCLDPAVIRNGIVGTEGVQPYNILILFFSLAYMAITLDITGILKAAAYWVSNKGGSDGWRLYLYFYIMLTLLSILLGNDPVILSGTAFLVYYTNVTGIKPVPWIMAEFAAANTASMVLFVGNPTNVVICEGFNVNNAAFTAYTILPFLACNLVCFLALAAQYHNRVDRVIERKENLDPRKALHDPFGAVVGSFMLGATLIICLVVSFFGVDVWMISLPFAVGKFVFDLCWDYYRYSKGIAMVIGEDTDSQKTISGEINDSEKSPRRPSQDLEQSQSFFPPEEEPVVSPHTQPLALPFQPSSPLMPPSTNSSLLPSGLQLRRQVLHDWLNERFPTFMTALPRLPFGLVPFAFSQFILIEALNHQGWVNTFASWLVKASHKEMHPTIWLIGVLGVILCNLAGTNIGATILLTQVVRAADLPYPSDRAAAIALAVASNIGAVSFTFSASLAGLLWRTILGQKGVNVRQRDFALWNMLPLLVMTSVGLGVVSTEMAVLFA